MEGKSLLRTLRDLLAETSGGSFMNDRTSYDYLYNAVQDFNFRTHYLTNTQTINIIAGTSEYNLNADYVSTAFLDQYNRPYVKWTYSGNDTFIYNVDYANVVLENSTSTASTASAYSITDAAQPANVTGSATSSGAATNGECTLTDNTADFTVVSIGDYIHNTTDGSDGVVTSITSATQIVTALFEGTNNDWTSGDAYIIVRQPKYKIVFTPTPSDAATVTVFYIQRPNPVYSPYRAYKLPFNYNLPIVQFAAFLYKYRDREPNYGDSLFKYYDGFSRKIAAEMRRGIPEKQGIRVNFNKMSPRSKPIGNFSR